MLVWAGCSILNSGWATVLMGVQTMLRSPIWTGCDCWSTPLLASASFSLTHTHFCTVLVHVLNICTLHAKGRSTPGIPIQHAYCKTICTVWTMHAARGISGVSQRWGMELCRSQKQRPWWGMQSKTHWYNDALLLQTWWNLISFLFKWLRPSTIQKRWDSQLFNANNNSKHKN